MDKTQLKIIDLIKPYMNKELSEGCLFSSFIEWYCGPGNGSDCFDDERFIGQLIAIEDDAIEENNGIFDKGSFLYKKICITYPSEDGGEQYYFEKNDIFGNISHLGKDDIIGHYDITSVIKYIQEKIKHNHKCSFDNFSNYSVEDVKLLEFDGYELCKTHKIPMKPLHLYTDEENEKLLKLLLSLK